MANQADELTDLRKRVEALETLVEGLRRRIEDLEAADGGLRPDFHMADQEPTV
jgi:hypothetical protein